MPFYIRKIDKAKWAEEYDGNVDNISADAVTVNLKTSDKTLSLWRVENESDVEKAVIALATSTGNKRIDTIDVAVVEEENILHDFKLTQTEGKVAVKSYAHLHYDMCGLTLGPLRRLAGIIASSGPHKRYSKQDVKRLLKRARDEGLIDMGQLADDLRQSIESI